MTTVDLIMPKMGESIMEATILKWVKKEGDPIAVDETILEIATDKVDSEIPSPVAGTMGKILFKENDVVPIGTVIAQIQVAGDAAKPKPTPAVQDKALVKEETSPAPVPAQNRSSNGQPASPAPPPPRVAQPVAAINAPVSRTSQNRFYSPLVRNIAQQEGISTRELDTVPGTGLDGRVTKNDLLAYVSSRGSAPEQQPAVPVAPTITPSIPVSQPVDMAQPVTAIPTTQGDNVEIIEMDRMRQLIADHMVRSKHTAPHVTSFVEVDVTSLVQWREKIKDDFQKQYGQKITFTPIFIEAVVRAIRDFPMINISVDGTRIIRKKDIHIGMAAALPSGNLIVPVIRNADYMNLMGLTKTVNDLAERARKNQLKPDEIQGGTFTLTNVGTFGNVMGTPIINQPQVAILATGAIRKKPAVIETKQGDIIAIRHMMFLSLSYDHRVVDGALGGSFLRRVADYLEGFDPERPL
ncbi:MAG TPA: dihydrolipoamide acetyltransferase family protein [Saprospiraceae bacterium]|nr:dihydrolipoamide acetyltransferase family protein [Saprospiraceae bacterium]